MELSRSNQPTAQILKSQGGFAMVLGLSLLPIILAAGFAFLFSSHLIKNWMQSLHICRTELLKTQSEAKKSLENLLTLNNLAASLRAELLAARMELAAAIAAENPGLIARAEAHILKVQSRQRVLDQTQKKLIFAANFQMNSGLQKVTSKLHLQDATNLSRSTSLFHFRINSIRTSLRTLAVHPDSPDIAPIYELDKNFTEAQGLSVSWNSSFQTNSNKGFRWIQNQHTKKDHCSASLQSQNGTFKEILTEDKL